MSSLLSNCQGNPSSNNTELDKIWQKIIATDAAYIKRKASVNISSAKRQLYLRRRHQLANKDTHNPQTKIDRKFCDEIPNHTCNLRADYLTKRAALLASKYGLLTLNSSASRRLTSNNTPESMSQLNAILDRYQRDDVAFPHRLSDSPSNSSSFSQRLTPRKAKNEISVGDLYAFSGIDIIFDHHKDSITRIRFAHNESKRLAVASADRNVSICNLTSFSSEDEEKKEPEGPSIAWLQPSHPETGAIMDIAWSASNDFLISASLDGSLCLWDMQSLKLARYFPSVDLDSGGILACEFHPGNNNYLAIADTNGIVQIVNMSTGRVVNGGRDQLHAFQHARSKLAMPCLSREDLSHYLGRGCVTAIAFDNESAGTRFWAGTDQGLIQSYSCNTDTGKLSRTRRIKLNQSSIPESFLTSSSSRLQKSQTNVHSPLTRVQPSRNKSSWFTGNGKQKFPRSSLPCITSLTARSWLSQNDSRTYLLANTAGLGLLLFLVLNSDGQLTLQRQFDLLHSPLSFPPMSNYGLHLLHSCFAPLICFGSSSCVVSASEDGNVYVFEVLAGHYESRYSSCVTYFQGHTSPVVDVALSWDESVLASADESGSVIIWRRQSN